MKFLGMMSVLVVWLNYLTIRILRDTAYSPQCDRHLVGWVDARKPNINNIIRLDWSAID
jgi:hypothetical protein